MSTQEKVRPPNHTADSHALSEAQLNALTPEEAVSATRTSQVPTEARFGFVLTVRAPEQMSMHVHCHRGPLKMITAYD